MRKYLLAAFLFCSIISFGQENNKKTFTPYIAVYAGGCVYNPFQFVVGAEKTIKDHLTIAYDVHYWKTGYEDYCDDMYSKGKFRSITPSVKISYNTGKMQGMGFIAGVGLGFMFAKDRGTEQTYVYNESLKSYNYGTAADGNWDFNSIAPSVMFGVGLRILKFPVTFNSTYYFGKTTEGWMATAGGAGFKIGLKKVK